MQHPLLSNRRNILIYAIIWVPVILLHGLGLQALSDLNFNQAITDAILFDILFMFIGLPIWFVVYYNRLDKSDQWIWIFSHLVSAAIVTVAWTYAGSFLLKLFQPDAYNSLPEGVMLYRLTSGFIFYIIITLAYYLLITNKENEEKLRNEERLIRLARESELKALKWQINPHFLFNSLNSANYLTLTNPDKASQMLVVLSEYLRYSLRREDKDLVSLEEELINCRRYLEIETYRFGDRLITEWDMQSDCNQSMVPVMILQPLYENAVKHGVYESTGPVTISSACKIENNILTLKIENNFDPDAVPPRGAGVGLRNVSDRLTLKYGINNLLKTAKSENRFAVTVNIPQNKTEIS